MISTVERRDNIINLIYKEGNVKVNDLSKKFGVSNVTIRNDLNALEKKGILLKTHGGAILRNNIYQDPELTEKKRIKKTEKEKIGMKAAELAEDGEFILIDSGTTTLAMSNHLKSRKDLTVMTNSINVAATLGEEENFTVMLTGGTLRAKSYSLVGPDAEATLRNYYFDKVFIGVDGMAIEYGITTPNPMEAQLNRLMVNRARSVIAVTDSSKFDRHSFSYICDVDVISTLVTDSNIKPEFEMKLLNKNINVIKA